MKIPHVLVLVSSPARSARRRAPFDSFRFCPLSCNVSHRVLAPVRDGNGQTIPGSSRIQHHNERRMHCTLEVDRGATRRDATDHFESCQQWRYTAVSHTQRAALHPNGRAHSASRERDGAADEANGDACSLGAEVVARTSLTAALRSRASRRVDGLDRFRAAASKV